MSKLSVKTRGNFSPQGKPRVYLSCHPDDFPTCSAILIEDIFKTQDCAVYYEADWIAEADDNELMSNLLDMQLFVVPITTNFLTKASRARDFEYRFAIENHTPLLPIAMEPGLDTLFPEIMNRIGKDFGEIQFLDRTSQDITAISYKEKLKNRLDSVLIGNALAERVRNAFHTRIFLSYRKIDRSMARGLMSLIHQIPDCLDVAIWYDEYLVPGEVFYDGIALAMEKSALVVLAVTPNLLVPGNYIIEHEYPDALKSKKEIVPAELRETDQKKFKILFPKTADMIDGNDPEAVSAVLHERLPQLEQTHVVGDPEHDYLIGLAYLGGIDMERDPEKAVKLIRNAAERNFPESIEKLAAMYHDGDGVERSYEEEIICRRKLVEVRRKAYEKNWGVEDGRELISACFDLGRALSEMEKLDRAEEAYGLMLKSAERVYEDDPSDLSRRDLCLSYDCLGVTSRRRGALKLAEDWFQNSLKIRKWIAQETGTIESKSDLCFSYNCLGLTSEEQGNLKSAEDWFRKSLSINERIAQEAGTIESKSDLCSSYKRLGEISQARGNLENAEDWLRKSLSISERLVQEANTIQAYHNLCSSYERLGEISQARSNLDDAEEWFRKALSIREMLAQEAGTIESRRDLCSSYERLGEISQKRGNLELADEWFLKSLGIDETLAQESGSIESRRDLCSSYERMGEISQERGNLESAEEWFLKSLSIKERLAQETGTIESYNDLSLSYSDLGTLSLDNQNATDAVNYLESAIEILEMVVKDSDDPVYQYELDIMNELLKRIQDY